MKKTRFVFLFLAVLPLVTFLGCSLLFDSSNGDPVPPPVVAIDPEPSEDDPVVVPDSRMHQLQLQAESDDVLFLRSLLEYQVWYRILGSAPTWIVLDESSGEVEVTTAGAGLVPEEKLQATVEFYSSYNLDSADDPDGGSTIDKPFAVTFYVEGEPGTGSE